MSWPLNARYRDFVANVTTITYDSLNAIQDSIYGVIGGSKSIKSLWIDSVGNVASAVASGALRVKNGITVDTVGLTATAGNIVATVGDITATAGNVVAGNNITATATCQGATVNASSGDVTSAAGNIKGRRYKSNGASLVNGDIGTIVGYGATASAAVTGTDSAGTVTITAAGGGYGALPTFIYTFHDGTWTTAPLVDVALMWTSDATAVAGVATWQVTATTVTVTFSRTPVGGNTYQFAIRTTGQ